MNDTTIDTPVATGGRDKGFTLVELLIVIVILGILATVTVFAVRGISDKGDESACAADENTLSTAIESYFAQEGVDSIPMPVNDPATTVDESANAAYTLVSEEFLRSISSKYTITSTGALTPISGGGCEPPAN